MGSMVQAELQIEMICEIYLKGGLGNTTTTGFLWRNNRELATSDYKQPQVIDPN